jgi:membrane protease YdiL (CAAX protease family)
MDKKGESVGFSWIIGIIFLFILGISFVIFNQVLTVHVEPLSESLINNSPYLNSTEIDDVKVQNDKFMAFWNSLPFIIVFIIVIYIIVTGFRRGDVQ